MRTEPFGTEVIERYLRTRRLRYFRGCRDGEYFFILTVEGARLHVHLETTQPEACTIRVTPAWFFPVEDRARLLASVDRWNSDKPWANAIVHESSDPRRVGVDAEYTGPGARYEEFVSFADRAISSAIELFGELTPATVLLDAG